MSISPFVFGVGVFPMAMCSIALAQSATARACVSIDEPMARLACYDRAMSRESQPDGAGPAAARVPEVSTASPTASGDAAFGLPAVTRAGSVTSSIGSHIVGPFDGWVAGTRWMLANGQVWSIADGSSTGYPVRIAPQVRVRQGNFGGYFIEIEGVSQSPRVRRLQ